MSVRKLILEIGVSKPHQADTLIEVSAEKGRAIKSNTENVMTYVKRVLYVVGRLGGIGEFRNKGRQRITDCKNSCECRLKVCNLNNSGRNLL